MATDHCPAWAPPLLAIQFLTRIPVPGVSKLSEPAIRIGLGRAIAWFPLVGSIVGGITAGTLLLTDKVWPTFVAVLLALIVEARLTGAFHEDAVADFCDGVGGGRDPEHARQIMKDSRIGTYGALGLTLAVALRAALTYALASAATGNAFTAETSNPMAVAIGSVIAVDAGNTVTAASSSAFTVALTIIAASTFGRLLAVLVMATTRLAPVTGGLAKDVTAALRLRDIGLAAVTSLPALVPFARHAPWAALATAAAASLFLIWFRALIAKRVGGATGDCIGFAAYIGQLLLLLAATGILGA